MKFTPYVQKLFLLVFLAIVSFACQDEQIIKEEPVQSSSQESEDASNDANARRGQSVYVLVHGAWHPESSWRDVKFMLQCSGAIVKTVQLPGLGNDATPVESVTFQDHVNAVKNVVMQQYGNVILVGHSYGGAVISQVGEEISQKIKKLVYVSGFMPINGESILELALSDTASLVTKNLIVDGAVAYLTKANYGKALYNQALASHNPFTVYRARTMIGLLRPHPVVTLVTPLHLTSNYDGLEKVYIYDLKDRAVTPASQLRMCNRIPGIKMYTLPQADHVPLITNPFELAELLRKL